MKISLIVGELFVLRSVSEIAMKVYGNNRPSSIGKVKTHLKTLDPILEKKRKSVLNRKGKRVLMSFITNNLTNILIEKNILSDVIENKKINKFVDDFSNNIEKVNDYIKFRKIKTIEKNIVSSTYRVLTDRKDLKMFALSQPIWEKLNEIEHDANNIKEEKRLSYKIDKDLLFKMFIKESRLNEDATKKIDNDDFKNFLLHCIVHKMRNTKCTRRNFMKVFKNIFSNYKLDVTLNRYLQKSGIDTGN